MGTLYFGDNLDILREHIKDESIDLIYLDPPFNSKQAYNLLFKTPKGQNSDAEITAFEDTWHWGEQAEKEFSELLHQSNTDVSEMIQSLRRFLKESDMYDGVFSDDGELLARIAQSFETDRKLTGSLYLHCDPTASYYLKIVLDSVFGVEDFQNEITWKRSCAHNDTKQGRKAYGNIADILLYYTKTEEYTFNPRFEKYDEEYVRKTYNNLDPDGRRWKSSDLTGPGGVAKGNPSYEFLGVTRYWRFSKENMERLLAEGRVYQANSSAVPRMKHYLDEMQGIPLQNIWDDIPPISSQAQERLGYPTQKPLALLERTIEVSSNKGDVVLDPFCGCGTAVHAAQTLEREWIGIDITSLAIGLIEKRMKAAFPNITFKVEGTPKDLDGARNLAERDKYQFQWWACSLVEAQPYQGKKKGADTGIDGIIFFQDDNKEAKKIIVSVKGGENVGVTMVKDLIATVEREKAAIGLFVTLAEPTKPMMTEAVSVGFYEFPKGQFPKIQILTIEDLLSGKSKPQYFDMSAGSLNFKKAKTEEKRADQSKLEGF